MTPHQRLVMRELTAANTGTRPTYLTTKTVTALTGLSKDDTEAALTTLETTGRITMTVRSGVRRYAAL